MHIYIYALCDPIARPQTEFVLQTGYIYIPIAYSISVCICVWCNVYYVFHCVVFLLKPQALWLLPT